MNHQMLVLLSKRHDGANPTFSQHVLALELLRLSVSKLITEEIIAVLPSHSQFRLQNNLYLDLHGLVFETSIYHWQDQPGSVCSTVVLYPTCVNLTNRLLSFKPPQTITDRKPRRITLRGISYTVVFTLCVYVCAASACYTVHYITPHSDKTYIDIPTQRPLQFSLTHVALEDEALCTNLTVALDFVQIRNFGFRSAFTQ